MSNSSKIGNLLKMRFFTIFTDEFIKRKYFENIYVPAITAAAYFVSLLVLMLCGKRCEWKNGILVCRLLRVGGGKRVWHYEGNNTARDLLWIRPTVISKVALKYNLKDSSGMKSNF